MLKVSEQTQPIPRGMQHTWNDIYACSIKECEEAFIPLSLSGDHFFVRSAYALAGYDGAFSECFVRQRVQQALVTASRLLPAHLRFVILDGWRGKELQTALLQGCEEALAEKHPEKSKAEITLMAQEFVALPSDDPKRPSPHSTGGAIDLCLATKDGQPLFFGSPFDFPTEISHTRYFEEKLERGEILTKREEEALENRRILYHAMVSAGFCNYDCEWWHFEYGTQRWALSENCDHAMYGAKSLVFNAFTSLCGLKDDEVLVSSGG